MAPIWLVVAVVLAIAVAGVMLMMRALSASRADALLEAYAAAEGDERDRIAEAIRAGGDDDFVRLIRRAMQRPRARPGAVDLILHTPPGEIPAGVADAAAPLLRSDEGEERAAAREVLSHLGERAIGALESLLEGDADAPVKVEAIGILAAAGERGEAAVIDFYVSLFRHPDRLVRNAAARELEKIGRLATPRLVQALRDPVTEARIFAAITLGRTRDRRAVEALIRGLGEEEEDLGVKVHIGDALARITQRVGRAHDRDLWWSWWEEEAATYPPQILPPGGK